MHHVHSNLIDWIRLPFRRDRESYLCFYRIMGFFPRDIAVFRHALLHKSTAVKSAKGRPLNNERLEFLGDAILDAVVGDIVFRHFPGRREGFLTNTRSKIVQRETLNKLAVQIGLNRLVKSSSLPSSHNSYMYGNAFEAFIGAIYLDRGYHYCYRFMEERIFKGYIDLDKMSRKEVNFKSKLIEWSQKNKVEVSFELIEQMTDKDMNPVFHTEVRVMGIPAGKGFGYSKKESQQNAAQTALRRIKGDTGLKQAMEKAKAKIAEEEQRLAEEEQREQTKVEEIALTPAHEEVMQSSDIEAVTLQTNEVEDCGRAEDKTFATTNNALPAVEEQQQEAAMTPEPMAQQEPVAQQGPETALPPLAGCEQ